MTIPNEKIVGNNNNGYTLLEVIVALLIVAMSLGAIFQNLAQSNRTAIRSEKTLKAVRLAHNIFNDMDDITAIMRGEVFEKKISGEENWYYRFSAEPLVLETLSEDGMSMEIEGVKKIILCILHGPEENQQSFCFEKWRRP